MVSSITSLVSQAKKNENSYIEADSIPANENERNLFPMGPENNKLIQANAKEIHKFIVGIDKQVLVLTEDKANLHDPFAKLIWKKETLLLTAHAVIKAFEETKSGIEEGKLIDYEIFLIDESGQIPEVPRIPDLARLIFAMRTNQGIGPDILINTIPEVESKDAPLELMSWDPINKAYNYYQRLGNAWIWSGNSFNAFDEKARFKGPFSGHTNGGPIMKELRRPWQHWSPPAVLIDNPPFKLDDFSPKSRYFQQIKEANIFEQFVKTGIHQWNQSRLEKYKQAGKIEKSNELFRQLLDTTNVNLISADRNSRSIESSTEIKLPFTFFANTEALSRLEINPDLCDKPVIVKGNIYSENLKKFGFRLEVYEGRKITDGDTHFAFFVPEAALEDIDLLDQMIEFRVISKRLAACLLMVDFPNPIYSTERASLLDYIPPTINFTENGSDLEDQFITNIEKATSPENGYHLFPKIAANQFLSYWKLTTNNPNWATAFAKEIENYFEKMRQLCKSQEGYDQVVILAESRKNRFRKTGQFEFEPTFSRNHLTFLENITPGKEIYFKMTSNGDLARDYIHVKL